MSESLARCGRARLILVGPFRLVAADGTPVAIASRRGRGLLAYLALAPDHAASREKLCGLLWSDRGEAQARASLRQVLLELRDAFSAAGLDLLDSGRDRIRLRADALSSDVDELNVALAGDVAAGVVTALEEVGRGRLLEDLEFGGLFQDWLDQTRPRIDRSIATGVQDWLERAEAAGNWADVRAVADAFLQRDAVDERVAASAIRAEVVMGAASAAHRRFQTLRAEIGREFGAEPGAVVSEALAGLSMPPQRGSMTAAKALGPIAAGNAPSEPVLAVLAFENLSGDPETGHFSNSLSEEILETIADGAWLKVIGRGSSFQFRGADRAASRVAAELKATHVLDGAVRRRGERIRIGAHLIDCASETTLWSSRFEGDLTDAFALQDDIAVAVASALKAALAAPVRARCELYCLFTDLEGFGELVRGLEPEMVGNLLNAYLDLLGRAVVEHGGTIDKFVGDAMIAFWGAPLAQPNDGERAARAAIAVWRAGETFRSTAAGDHPPIGRTRVGLHRGPVIVGNFGGEAGATYTALGEGMNTAARLETANRELSTRLLVSREALPPSMTAQFRAMGRIGLAGRSDPVEVFEAAVGFPPDARERLNAAYARFDSGETAALVEIAALSVEFPGDVALKGLVERLRAVGPGGAFSLG
jgi:TolB-like protein/DNA-binding SARP family transcriptional activator